MVTERRVGVEIRHMKGCSKGESCDCSPSYRAWHSGFGGKATGTWTKDASEASLERDRLEQGKAAPAAIPTLGDFVEQVFLPGIKSDVILSRKREPYKPAVKRNYESSLKHIAAIAELRMDRVARIDIQNLTDKMRADGAAAWTVINVVVALKAVYRHAIFHQELFSANPTVGVILPKGNRKKVVFEAMGEKDEMVIRSAKDFLKLIRALPQDQQAMFATAGLAGLRRGELRALRVCHIDFEKNRIYVRLSRDAIEGDIELKSDSGRRDIPIPVALFSILRLHVETLGKTDRMDFVFGDGPIDADKYLDQIRKVWQAAELEPLGLHDARHTFASMLIASGANVLVISKLMGHSSISVTIDNYGHLLPDAADEAIEALNVYIA